MLATQSFDQYLFACKVYNSRVLSRVLATIQLGKRDTNCQVVVTDAQVKFVVDLEDKSFQATAVLKPDVFQAYNLPSTTVRFAVNLSNLLDCLGLYGIASSVTAAQLYYPGPDNALVLALTEGDKWTECSLKTCRAEDSLDMRFSAYPLSSKVVMRSEVLKDIIADFDGLSDRVKFAITPHEVVWSAAGVAADCRVSIPSRADAFFFHECSRDTESEFLLNHLLLATKSVPRDAAEKTTLRTNSEGMLSVQHLLRAVEQGPTCAVEFVCLPLAEFDF